MKTLKVDSRETKVVVFSPDGTQLASGHIEGAVKLWDVSLGLEYLVQPAGYSDSYVRSVTFSPDGKKLARGVMTTE